MLQLKGKFCPRAMVKEALLIFMSTVNQDYLEPNRVFTFTYIILSKLELNDILDIWDDIR